MVVAIVIGNGMVEVHKAGCQDIARQHGKRFEAKWGYSFDTLNQVYDNFLDTGDENNPGYMDDEFKIYPCTSLTSV